MHFAKAAAPCSSPGHITDTSVDIFHGKLLLPGNHIRRGCYESFSPLESRVIAPVFIIWLLYERVITV